MINVLITGVGGDIGSAIAKCFRDEYGAAIMIHGCDVNPINQGLLYVDEFFVAPRADSAGYLDFILGLHAVLGFEVLIPSTESEIGLINESRMAFEHAGIKLMMNAAPVLSAFCEKLSTAKMLGELGVRVPETAHNLEELHVIESRFPIIVKENAGCGSKGIVVAHSVDEAVRAAGCMRAPIFQQYIGSAEEEYTVGVFSNGEAVETITFRRELGYGGMTIKAECVEVPEINGIANTIAAAFSLRGAINIQLRKDEGEYYVFEINPRLSSTVRLRYKAGFKDCIWWLEFLLYEKMLIEYKPIGSFVGIKTLDEALFGYSDDGSLVPVLV